MKFNVLKKTLLILLILFIMEVSAVKREISLGQKVHDAYLKNSQKANKSFDSKQNFPYAYRFQDEYEKMNNIKEKNILMMNSEVLNAKPPTDKDDFESDVLPNSANAGSEFKWTFLWWTIMHFPARNALRSDGTYWLSQRGRQHDHWEAVFDQPQKIDVIDIKWRLAPKRFRVFIKLDDNSEYIPVTGVFEKTSFINKEGKISSHDAISEFNAIVFNKPIFAKRVRINLNEPVKHGSFSIFFVKFYQKRTTMLIKNELIDTQWNYCMYVNTNMPVDGTKVEVYPCLRSLTLANNNELWVYYNDYSIRHYNSKMCLGFDVENDLALRSCGDFNPSFTLKLRHDSTMYFTGYENKCIVVDEKKKVSSNFLNEDTEITVTSQADLQTFKKENIKFDGENYWHSAPGQTKATVQVFFGKITKGVNKGKFENKKIDMIKIEWVREPKKFSIFTWKPGFSWTLQQVYTNYKSKTSEISIIGEDAAAIMIVMDESHIYPELGNITAYAIREVSITYNSMKLKNDNCANFSNKFKVFDFDTQNYHKLENTKDYKSVRKKLSLVFEKMISSYTGVKKSFQKILKSKLKAEELKSKLQTLKKNIASESVKQLRNFKADVLPSIKNSMFTSYLESLGGKHIMSSITDKNATITSGRIGTKDLPATDCLNIRKLHRKALSGWYYVKNDCSPKPLRVFCDFTIFGDAVDIYVYNDGNTEPNPDLSYLNIKDFNSVRFICSKVGLFPIQVNNKDTVKRIYQVLNTLGYDLSKSVAVPLGYDYSCKNGHCRGMVNSINDKQTPVMGSFFSKNKKGGNITKPGPFAGLGYSDRATMLSFNAHEVQITGLICSSNHFKTDSSDSSVKTISCEISAASNAELFTEGSNILVECPASCHNALKQVFGTNQYHLKSSVCKSAVHAGVIGSKGGKMYVRVGKGIERYSGTSSNGVTSEDFETKDGMNSFSLLKYTPKCPIDQFKELAKAEKDAESDEHSSFIEMRSESSYKSNNHENSQYNARQAHDQFEKDLNSNDFEAVDLEDIQKAGLKAQSENIDMNKSDNDSEDYNYNHNHSNDESISNSENMAHSNLEGLNNDVINDVNGMVNYNNNDSNSSDLVGDSNPGSEPASDDMGNNFKFAQNEELLNSETELESGVALALESETNLNTENETFFYTENNLDLSNEKRDRLTSQDPNQKQQAQATQMVNNINNAKTAVQGVADNVLNKLGMGQPKNPGETRVPPPVPPKPKPGQTAPPQDDPPKVKKPGEQGPTTDDGNRIMMRIRQVVDWDYLAIIVKKTKIVKEKIDNFQKNLAWSRDGSKLSMNKIKKKMSNMEKYKMKIGSVMKKLSNESFGRVMKTKKVKSMWRQELNKLESKEDFKINYALPVDVLLKKVMFPLDAKCVIKSNWNVFKEGLKDRPRAIGITSKIFSKNQLGASILKIAGREYFDFKLSVDILVKSNGVSGVAFRMKDEYNYYAFVIDKMAGTKSIVKVVDGKKTDLKSIKDGGILVNNWHKLEIKANAGHIKVFIYDTEQVNKTQSEKKIEVNDYSYSVGGIGFFVNNMEGFYFDEVKVTSANCSTPWEPTKGLDIRVPLSAVYTEDFSGTIESKFTVNEPDDVQDGPSKWTINQYASIGDPLGLYQRSSCYDKSSHRRPIMMLKNEKYLANGVISVTFTPYTSDGTVSIIFKYLTSKSASGDVNESFYLFEAVNQRKGGQFVLRKFVNGIVKEITSTSDQVKGLPTVGYLRGVPNSVQIEVLGQSIKVRYSMNNSQLVEVLSARDSSIPYGLVGVGTYKVKSSFSTFEIFPPKLQISEAEKTKILSSDSEEIFFPTIPGVDMNMANYGGNGNIPNKGGDTRKNNTGEMNGSGLGIKECMINNTVRDRKSWCSRTFNVIPAKERCNNNFCDTCCDKYTDKSKKTSMYVCKKACRRSTVSEPAKDDYKAICIISQNPLNSIYDYCDTKISDPDSKKTCKLDMCNLCCSTLDSIVHKQFSINSIKKCFEACSHEFNK